MRNRQPLASSPTYRPSDAELHPETGFLQRSEPPLHPLRCLECWQQAYQDSRLDRCRREQPPARNQVARMKAEHEEAKVYRLQEGVAESPFLLTATRSECSATAQG